MAIGDLPLLGLLKTGMRWHQARQGLLAQNVAYAETPGSRPSGLKPMNAGESVRAPALASVATRRTHAAHIKGAPMGICSAVFERAGAQGL